MHYKNQIFVLLAGICLLFLSAIPLCSAWAGNSTNYNIIISNADYAAYDGHSANYNIDFSLAGQYVGWNDSKNYNTTYGFYGAVNYTGYSVGGPFDISIDAPTSVTASTTTTATVQLTNQNPDFGEDSYLEYWIEDMSGNTKSSGSKTVYVGSLSTVQTTVSLTAPGSAGVYVYYARVTWSTIYTAMASESFTVTAAPGGGEEEPGGGGGKVPVLRITQYPTNMTVKQGDFRDVVIEISNIGTATAKNTVLLIQNISQYWFSIEPQSIDIEANENESFAVRFNIPSDAKTGAYDFIIKAMSGSVKREVESTLNVITTIPDEVVITDIRAFMAEQNLQANKTGKVQVVVRNNGQENTNITVQLTVPDAWETGSTIITKTVPADEDAIFEFTVVPDREGTFELILSISYGSEEKTRMVAVVVESGSAAEDTREQESFWSILAVIIIIAAIILLLAVYLFLKSIHGKKQPPAQKFARKESGPLFVRHTDVRRFEPPTKSKPEPPRESRAEIEYPGSRGTINDLSVSPSILDKLLRRLKKKKK